VKTGGFSSAIKSNLGGEGFFKIGWSDTEGEGGFIGIAPSFPGSLLLMNE